MSESPQKELAEIRAKLAACRHIPDHLRHVDRRIRKLQKELRQAKKVVRKEEADVNKLYRASVNSLFPRFLKSKEKQMEIEQQEYIAAALKYNACLDMLEVLEYERSLLETRLEQLPELEKAWQRGLEHLKAVIYRDHEGVAKELGLLERDVQQAELLVAEIDEAVKTGVRARRYLKSIAADLGKIKQWGQWPRGRGHYALYEKKSLIDKARKKAARCAVELATFEEELQDVFTTLSIADAFNLDDFERFLDVFYDHLITDWVVRKNLKQSVSNIEMAVSKVERFLGTLRSEKRMRRRLIRSLQLKIENLILRNA